MNRDCELQRLVREEKELFEQIRGKPNDLDLRLQFAELVQQIRAIENTFSLTALFFARRH